MNGVVRPRHLAALRLAAGLVRSLICGGACIVQPPLQIRHHGLILAIAPQQLLGLPEKLGFEDSAACSSIKCAAGDWVLVQASACG